MRGRRRTCPGRPYTAATFARDEAPCVYLRDRPTTRAFVVGMPYRVVQLFIERRMLRRARHLESAR